MKRYAIVFSLILIGAVLFADEQLVYSFTGTIGRMFGQTSYELKVPDPVQGVMSLLEFPLGSMVASFNINLEKHTESGMPWAVRTSVKTNITNPGNVMKDSDWYLYQGYPPVYFSYTESDTEMRFLQASIRADKKLYSMPWFDIYATGGYRYQYADYNIMGYVGWQYIYNGTAYDSVGISAPSTLKVMEYHIIHHAPTVGFAFHIDAPNLTMNMAAGYQLVLISDYDDHVLRSKLSTAEGIGHGILCSLEGQYKLKRKIGSFEPFIFIAADFSYTYADIKQTQEWYGNLDSVPEGTVYTGISHKIKSALFTSTLGVGLYY